VFNTGERLLTEALNALGVKNKLTRQDEKVQIAINTLPWPRSEIVALSPDEGIGAQKGTKQFAIVQTGPFCSSVIDPVQVQLNTVGRGATSTTTSNLAFNQ
jgi:hypothetical protein